MGNKTWAAVKTELRQELWSFPTEARTQVAFHDKSFLEGVMDLQKWVPCLQVNNTRIFEFCSTMFHCGKTVVAAPPWGVPKRIYTIADGEWCDEIFYRSASFNDVNCFVRSSLVYTSPDNTGMATQPMGFKFADASSDNDCDDGRARGGLWNVYRGRLYVAPWIQSNETLVLEWDGMKEDWIDTDVLDDTLWTARVLAALRGFVEWKHACRFGDDMTEKLRLQRQYEDDLAALIHDCREATAQQKNDDCSVHVEPVTMATIAMLRASASSSSSTDTAALEARLAALEASVAALESGSGGTVNYHGGGFLDPNGNVTGNEGDVYVSESTAGGDGATWWKRSGTGNANNTGWGT